MDGKSLQFQMTYFHRWRTRLVERFQRFQTWIDRYPQLAPSARQSLAQACHQLQSKEFTLVCVGEFSRGKTELINALLYLGNGERLLPSTPGRTTMCPTEILWDASIGKNCVKLLPIETRRSPISLQRFKRIPHNWVSIDVDVSNPDIVRAAIDQVAARKWMSKKDARALGFTENDYGTEDAQGRVSVPAWRHALIHIDHPLLRQGLRIIDTPGLNALGNEPELTLKTLPEAQAVLFLLAADSGMTASDWQIWAQHIEPLTRESECDVLALLNKTDSIHDPLISDEQNRHHLTRLCVETAKTLGLSAEHIYPLSAKKGLLGKVNRDDALLKQSYLPLLEKRIGQLVIAHQQKPLKHTHVLDAQQLITRTYETLQARAAHVHLDIRTLTQDGQGTAFQSIAKQREFVRKAHHSFHKQTLSLRTSQQLLNAQRFPLLHTIDLNDFDALQRETEDVLKKSWTSLGLSRAMEDFLETVDSQLHHLDRELERCNRLVQSIYERAPEVDQRTLHRRLLNIVKYQHRWRHLYRQGKLFSRSMSNMLLHKSAFIQRFMLALAQESKNIYAELHAVIDEWFETVLAPLEQTHHYQKKLLEHHMLQLTEMQFQQNDKAQQAETLRESALQLDDAIRALQPLYDEISAAPLAFSDEEAFTDASSPTTTLRFVRS